MPRGDKTGPEGQGSMTGRAAGYCAGYSVPGFMKPTYGYGRGLGRGYGRGLGRGYRRGFGRGMGRRFVEEQTVYPQRTAFQPAIYPIHQRVEKPESPEQEIALLENYQIGLQNQKADIEQEMDDVKARIEELQTKIQDKNNK